MIAGIFLCFVAVGITLGAILFGHGGVFVIMAALSGAGLLLGLVSVAYARTDFTPDDHTAKH